MSSSERQRRSKRARVLCAACQERKAKFRYRREVRADRDHTLCFECYRSEVNRTRARRLAEGAPRPPTALHPVGSLQAVAGRALDNRQLMHRQRMLDHLQRRSSETLTVEPSTVGTITSRLLSR
jgi:hypothetical protein